MDFRHFQLKQTAQQAGMRPRQHDLRSFGQFFHFDDICLDSFAITVRLATDLFGRRQYRFGFAEIDEYLPLFDPLNHTGHDVIFAIGILIKDQAAFRFANPLHDDLLGVLRGNPAKILRRDFLLNDIADLKGNIDRFGSIQRNFLFVIRDCFHDILAGKNLDCTCLPVHCHPHILGRAEIPLICRNQRCLNSFKQDLGRNPPFPCQLFKC